YHAVLLSPEQFAGHDRQKSLRRGGGYPPGPVLSDIFFGSSIYRNDHVSGLDGDLIVQKLLNDSFVADIAEEKRRDEVTYLFVQFLRPGDPTMRVMDLRQKLADRHLIISGRNSPLKSRYIALEHC